MLDVVGSGDEAGCAGVVDSEDDDYECFDWLTFYFF